MIFQLGQALLMLGAGAGLVSLFAAVFLASLGVMVGALAALILPGAGIACVGFALMAIGLFTSPRR
ncbi:MAG TPA: hypothetical protein GYA10_09815 [Alphaproteobacteria bacterium]|nr:hypothetical protein [Alphaproteobacteria bacterium]